MKFNIEFKGIDEIIAYYDKVEKELQEDVKKAINKSVKVVLINAKNSAPVDTGNLRRSIHSELNIDKGKIEGKVVTAVDYAPYVEFGTGELGIATNTNSKIPVTYTKGFHGQVAQPFFYPVYYEEEENFKRALKDILKKGLK
jgi:bacteriophage protein of unknown function (DUF646)|nr:MAG TPA: putative tail component [Caudoviricetes sp.]